MSTTNSIDLGGLSKQYAARDLPGQLKLKYRDIGQAAPEELRKDKRELRKELEEREKLSGKKDTTKRLSLTEGKEVDRSKRQKIEAASVNLDADEVLADSESEDEDDLKKKTESEDDTDDDDEDDDDTEALMAELNKIKQERAAEAARLEAEKKVREEKIRVENILKGNPLLNEQKPGTSDFKVKRRWDDDVVFKNCAKIDGDKKQKDFINDTLRSEFHKKFMERYIK
ncbi:CWC15 -like protein [Brachionus plicatilis]|uniref:CWC15-like protein n=1 Tax=Brachionus plicatilis TaxID=10195 RepID=A0A3M7P3Q1_BRAPC|nr:CWC15 -like protein [Brachionus plicatilis]